MMTVFNSTEDGDFTEQRMPDYEELDQAAGYHGFGRPRRLPPVNRDAWYMRPGKMAKFVLMICAFIFVLSQAWLAGIGRLGEFWQLMLQIVGLA